MSSTTPDLPHLSTRKSGSSELIRRPRQARGERRVDAILDAAAALIAQGGVKSLTVQSLADRAQTSKGSLYHFFPDLDGVLRGLAQRHTAALTALTSAIIADRDVPWTALPLADAIERFLAPLSYLKAHPDLMALARTPVPIGRTTQRLAPYRDLAAHLLEQRCPSLPMEPRLAAASAMVAIVDGVVGYALRSDDVTPEAMAAELKRALVAYVSALEADARIRTGGQR